jgi:hypothetical protein
MVRFPFNSSRVAFAGDGPQNGGTPVAVQHDPPDIPSVFVWPLRAEASVPDVRQTGPIGHVAARIGCAVQFACRSLPRVRHGTERPLFRGKRCIDIGRLDIRCRFDIACNDYRMRLPS